MEQDFGAQITGNGRMVASNRAAYDFGQGDFSVTALFQTTAPGTIVSKKTAEGGSSDYAGWLVVLKPNGEIKFATDNGYGFYEINSEPTRAFDGAWHSVAAVRRRGQLELWFDGKRITATPRSSLPTPLNVTGVARVMIGGTDQYQEPYNQFTGIAEDVSLWSRAIGSTEIFQSMFNLLQGNEPNLIGYWAMNNNTADSSPTNNPLMIMGTVSFVSVFHSVWVEGDNAFSFCRIDTHSDPVRVRARVGTVAETVQRIQYVDVPAGAPFLVAASNDAVTYIDYPADLQVTVEDPSGTKLDHDVDTDVLYVRTVNGSTYHAVVKDPQAGRWKVTIQSPGNLPFQFSLQTLPTGGNAIETMSTAIQPLFPNKSAQQTPSGFSPDSLACFSVAMAALTASPSTIGAPRIEKDNLAAIPVIPVALVMLAVAVVIQVGIMVYVEVTRDAHLNADSAPYDYGHKARGERTPAEIWKAIVDKVGDPATTDPSKFVTRADMGIDDSYKLTVDIGGEGYHNIHGVESGFADAINVNAQTNDSQRPKVRIPKLVHVNSWSTNPPFPFADGTIDYITMQGAPLTAKGVAEMARCVRAGGSIGLWIDRESFQQQIDELASLLKSTPDYKCRDEFDGRAGYSKICIPNRRT